MAKNRESVGSSGAIKDNSKDIEALERMKMLEKSLQRDLVSVALPDGTIITTTKNRIKTLLKEHGYKDLVSF